MTKISIVDRIISQERLLPYLNHHAYALDKAIEHYQANILISESFYPLLSILEVGLRNSINIQMSLRFEDTLWFENKDFINLATRYQLDRIAEARIKIQSVKKEITAGGIVSELTFGFWTSLFDTRFEMTLWKQLRLALPNCPKQSRKRKIISSKFNLIRKFRNRIFHYEAISWNLDVLNSYKLDVIGGLNWLNNDLLEWCDTLNHVEETIERNKNKII